MAKKAVAAMLITAATVACAGWTLPDIPFPVPPVPPTTLPASSSPVPSPSPEAPVPPPMPTPNPLPIPTPTPSPTVVCPTPAPGFIIAPGFSSTYSAPKAGKCYAPVEEASNINWDSCGSCSDTRAYNKQQGHWIDEGRPDGWLRANAIGQPDGDKFVTRECGLVFPGGRIKPATSGRLGNICPPEVPGTVVVPSPVPSPTPQASPAPSPTNAPPLTESGNYPIPAIGTCPAHFQNQPFSLHVKVTCRVKGNGGRRCVLDATQRGETPFMEHTCYDESNVYALGNCRPVSEMWRGCQLPRYVDYIKDERGDRDPNPGNGLLMTIYHPSWGYFGACDKLTAPAQPGMLNPRENYRCQDSDEDGSRGVGSTTYRVCMPDGTKCVEGVY